MILSLIELWAAFGLPSFNETDESRHFSFAAYRRGEYLKTNLKTIWSKRVIWLSIVGLSVFWAISQVVAAAFPSYAKDILQIDNVVVIQGILACAGIGIMLGSAVAGRMSRNYIELGLIPVGTLGLAAVLMLLPTLDSRSSLALAYVAVGFMGGLLIVPLNALIQYHADEKQLGAVLAGNNWVQNIAMFGFLMLTVVFASAGIDSRGLFILVAAVAVGAAFYTLKSLPHSLTRVVASLIIKRAYRVSVEGFDNLPKTGPCLLLGNHISWIDWAMIQIACPRQVRFVMLRSIYERWYLKPVFKLFGVIPIGSGNSKGSLAAINEYLKAGEVVCLFPEGAISKTGQLGKFYSGFERTVEDVEGGVIVPFFLRGLWGSWFSKSFSKKLRRNTARGIKRDIVVAFGQPLPMDTRADKVKQKVFELSFDAWEHYTASMEPLPLTWLRAAKSHKRALAVQDSQGAGLTNAKLLAATLSFSQKIKRYCRPVKGKEGHHTSHNNSQRNVGILLPASGGALIANMAVLMRGAAVVNINYTASAEAVQSGLDKADVETVLTSERFIKKLAQRGIDAEAMLAGRKVVIMEELKAKISPARLIGNMLAASILPSSLIYHLYGRPVDMDTPRRFCSPVAAKAHRKGLC